MGYIVARNPRVSKQVLRVVKKYARSLRKYIRVEAVVLFGSHAPGTAESDSDIDVTVTSPDFSGDRFEDTRLLMRVRRNVDLRIEPDPFQPEDFVDEDPLAYEIRRYGIRV